MSGSRSLAFVVAVLAASLAGCSSNPGDASADENADAATTHAAATTAASSQSPTADDVYTREQRALLDSPRINWTGEPDALFETADAVCAAFTQGHLTLEDGVDATDDLVTHGRWLARIFFVEVMTTVCDPGDSDQRAAVAHEDALLTFVDRVNDSGLGAYIEDRDIRADAVEFCAAGAAGQAYNEFADRIRADYFDREARVRNYIATAFTTVCPGSAVAYTRPPPPPPKTSFSEGTWLVGADIAAGIYRATDVDGCYWERLSGLSGDFGDLLANDNISSGQAIVEIVASDKAFSSSPGCGTWHKIE